MGKLLTSSNIIEMDAEVEIKEPGRAYDLGIIDYARALRLQEHLVKARNADDIPDTFLFLSFNILR